ncbi:hypothetical protein SNE40_002832 [Patella caerulea]|uniref:Uncharacterized protein n=1 Tax=Patella caerulea TaxID=87958 RepID=A0AAN8KCP4_PATCE
MVRNYRRKSNRGNYGNNNLSLALKLLSEGKPLNTVSKEYGIPARTLRRHRDHKVQTPGRLQFGRHRQIFPEEVEKELKQHITEMERRMFGLTSKNLRRLAFDVAQKAGYDHPFNKETRMAGEDWLKSFLERNGLSLRQPQSTSMARIVGFNRPKVDQFFDLLRSIFANADYDSPKIWNMDETALTTVQKPSKIMAEKGIRQVGKVTSAERGELVTFICAMNAAGGYLPPLYVFPRKRMVDVLMKGSPPGSVGYVTESGWSDGEQFLKWLQHFATVTNASKNAKQIIILDGHHSHKTLKALEFCRDNGIELLTLPPHSTHKMQPLDRCYFKSLKNAYNQNADHWMASNPGRRISIYEIAELSCKAFLASATPEKAINGFKLCGLWPMDPGVFSEADFAGSKLTEEDENVPPTQTSQPSEPQSSRSAPSESAPQPSEQTPQPSEPTPKTSESAPQPSESGPQPSEPTPQPSEPSPQTSEPTPQPSEPAPQPSESAPQPSEFSQSSGVSAQVKDLTIPTTLVPTVGDGRCFFQSIAANLDVELQRAKRNQHGSLESHVLAKQESEKADKIRAGTVAYLRSNMASFVEFEKHVNADLPDNITFTSLNHRIETMANSDSMPGELEILAASRFLQRTVVIVNKNRSIISSFGEDYMLNTPLFVQFTSLGEDIGHYDCLSNLSASTNPGKQPAAVEMREIINQLSPLPKITNKRPRTRKAESATLLTSSPFKKILIEKEKDRETRKQKPTTKTSKQPKKPKKGRGKTKGRLDEDSDDEEWPCIICCEPYSRTRPGEVWIQCQVCLKWAHELCTSGTRQFICPNCESDDEL